MFMPIICNTSAVQENLIPNDKKQLDLMVAQIDTTPVNKVYIDFLMRQ